jgi:iron complex transport system substrate-binding protein
MRFSFSDALVKILLVICVAPVQAYAIPTCTNIEFKSFALEHSTQWRLFLSEHTAKVIFPGTNQTLYFSLSEIRECREAIGLDQRSRLGLTSTHELVALTLLNRTQLAIGMSNRHLVSDSAARGSLVELGYPVQRELLVAHSIHALFTTPFDNHLSSMESLLIHSLPLLDARERTALGRAEWLLYFGIILNEFEKAQLFYSAIVDRYEEALNFAHDGNRPMVLLGHSYHGQWFVPGVEHSFVQLILAAGFDYVFSDLNGHGPYPVSFEEVLKRSERIDYWLPQSAWSSLQEGMLIEGRHSFLMRNPKRQIYLLNREGASFPYFDLGAFRPDMILEDLVAIRQGREPNWFFYKAKRND